MKFSSLNATFTAASDYNFIKNHSISLSMGIFDIRYRFVVTHHSILGVHTWFKDIPFSFLNLWLWLTLIENVGQNTLSHYSYVTWESRRLRYLISKVFCQCFVNLLFRITSLKHQSSLYMQSAFVKEIHRRQFDSTHKRASNAEKSQ